MRWLALVFFVVPLVELWLLFQVGDALGSFPTVALVLGTALLGAFLAKREGLRVIRSFRLAVSEMRIPEEGITSGLLVLVGATLLISPGVLTDVVGIVLLVPPSRKLVARLLDRYLAHRFSGGLRLVVPGIPMSYEPRVPGAPSRVRVIEVDGKAVEER